MSSNKSTKSQSDNVVAIGEPKETVSNDSSAITTERLASDCGDSTLNKDKSYSSDDQLTQAIVLRSNRERLSLLSVAEGPMEMNEEDEDMNSFGRECEPPSRLCLLCDTDDECTN